ncbi:hypothetical protein [Streptomyces nodosus]|uniref:hypothetical protein n=1 Tax=Streptomyces nodosus TaxID=40318 RepID=UPI003F51AB0A
MPRRTPQGPHRRGQPAPDRRQDPGQPTGSIGEGVRAAIEARRCHPGLAVLVLSAYVEQAFATELLNGGVGGLGYLLKEPVGRVEEFLDALRRVTDGGTAIDPEVVAQLFTRSRQDTRLGVRIIDLSWLCQEVLWRHGRRPTPPRHRPYETVPPEAVRNAVAYAAWVSRHLHENAIERGHLGLVAVNSRLPRGAREAEA